MRKAKRRNEVTMKKPLIILTGPTAVGKTALSIELAKKIKGEIISADSMQVYKYMNIGTAKIMPGEMQGIRHYLIDEWDPAQEFNVFLFQQKALSYMDEIYTRGKIPILVGGTGFYIQSVLYQISFDENDSKSGYRIELEEEGKREGGAEALYEKLKLIDPVSAGKIHANNIKKVIRALEFYQQTGKLISRHNEEERQKESPYEFCYFVLNEERDILYRQIDKRVDVMIEKGLVEEVLELKERGYGKGLVSMQGLGYKEILNYLDGACTMEEAVEVIKRDTRHFAKRQLTWFRRERDVIWINKGDYQRKEALILDALLDKARLMLKEGRDIEDEA